MKLILSRKGFDSAAGGCGNPIMPDGTLVPLPIPSKTSPIRYDDITFREFSVGRLVADLTNGRIPPSFRAHLDPDLEPSAYPRMPGWRGLFGQADAAQTTLENEGVGPGDVFLFFGWFRQVEQSAGHYQFVRGEPDLHVLWGWLQVDQVLAVATSQIPRWARYHPHVQMSDPPPSNTLYIGRELLEIAGRTTALPGAGVFGKHRDGLRLTKTGASRTMWSLPRWFAPTGQSCLGYHADLSRWTGKGDRVELRSVARGQEFVLDVSERPDAGTWVSELIANAAETGKHA